MSSDLQNCDFSPKPKPPRTKVTRKDSSRQPVGWEPIPLDGDWGWVVVFGSFLIHVFADGIVYSFGVMMVELLDYFNEGKGLTSWILSLLVGLTLGTGPIASAVTNRYGCRASCIAGSIIAAIGCGMSFFATSVLYLMVSVGLVVGLGFGMMYCPAIIIVTMYFEEKRSLATGIAVCGAGLGTFIFAPLTSYLIETYTWRGAFLIYAGVVLNCGVCGALFRPLEFSPVYEDEEEGDNKPYSEVVSAEGSAMDLRPGQITPDGTLVVSSPIAILRTSMSQDISPNGLNEMNGVHLIPPAVAHLRDGRIRALSQTIYSPNNAPTGALSTSCMHPKKLTSHVHIQKVGVDEEKDQIHKITHLRPRIRGISESHGYLHVKDVFYPGSVTHLSAFNRDPELYRSISGLHHARPADKVVETIESDGRLVVHIEKAVPYPVQEETDMFYRIWMDLKEVMLEMVNLSILRDPLFLLYAISNFLTSAGFNAPLVFLPDRAAHELNIDKGTASWILSGFGITNTVGRVLIGFVSDRYFPCRYGKNKATNRLWIYNISLTIAGMITALSFIFTDFVSLTLYSALFGLFMSCYICLTSVILVDLLGLAKLTNAFGILLLFQGLASLVGPPIAGWIADATGTYTWSFVFAGVCIWLSGIMLFCIPCMQQRQSENNVIDKNSGPVLNKEELEKLT